MPECGLPLPCENTIESNSGNTRRVSALIILLLLSVPSLAHAQPADCGLPLPCAGGTVSDNTSALAITNSGNLGAIVGFATNNQPTTGQNDGVTGLSFHNDGVQGITTATQSDGLHAGVFGEAAQSDGVIGTSNSGLHAGVAGANTAGGNGIYGESASPGYAGYFFGDVSVNGTLSKAAGSFKIDHPLDPANQTLSHSLVESPDMMNIYNGNVITDAHGDATVSLPAYFESLNRDFRYQLTVIEQFAQAIISSEIKDNRFTIKTDKPDVKVSWMVTGVRQDAYANAHRISVEEYKAANEHGKYIHPALYGQPKEMGVNQSRLGTLQMQMEADATARSIHGAEQVCHLTEKMLRPKE